jgi:hypothetical protein
MLTGSFIKEYKYQENMHFEEKPEETFKTNPFSVSLADSCTSIEASSDPFVE